MSLLKEGVETWGIVLSKTRTTVTNPCLFAPYPEFVEIYDTTLRDGNQSVGVNFTASQKLKVAKAFIAARVDYVEGGWPNVTNQTDLRFFKLAQRLEADVFSHLASFGRTRLANTNPADDENLQQLLRANTRTITIFGKSWTLHVENILRTSLEENRRMIRDSIEFLRSHRKKVIYDAEHFFDGFQTDPDYALATLKTAEDAWSINTCAL